MSLKMYFVYCIKSIIMQRTRTSVFLRGRDAWIQSRKTGSNAQIQGLLVNILEKKSCFSVKVLSHSSKTFKKYHTKEPEYSSQTMKDNGFWFFYLYFWGSLPVSLGMMHSAYFCGYVTTMNMDHGILLHHQIHFTNHLTFIAFLHSNMHGQKRSVQNAVLRTAA